MQARTALDLSKVFGYQIVRSRCTREAQRQMCQAVSDHGLRWGTGQVDTSLYRRSVGQLDLFILRYGAEVEVSPDRFNQFALVQIPLQGRASLEADGCNLEVGNGDVAVLSARRGARIHWSEGCQQLLVKVPDSLLGGPAAAAVWQRSLFKLAPASASAWLGLLQQLLTLMPVAPGGERVPSSLDRLEQALALYLQEMQPAWPGPGATRQQAGPDPDHGQARAVDANLQRLEQLEAYIHQHLFAPLSLADLSAAAGFPARTLNAISQKYRGVSPMTMVRNIRLEQARLELQARPQTNVTDVAIRLGFGHLGRFSGYYRERFGETPRQTSAACRQAA